MPWSTTSSSTPGSWPLRQNLLKQGLERASQLQSGQAPWNSATGLVVRGYRSKIDGSVQPYGLIVPPTYREHSPHRFRLDVWCHGRGETLSEVNFIAGRQSSPGEFVPPNAFVLHPYGRYCNANKFAGEIDLFEALDHARRHYPIDDDRLVIRGFSMGGAACWQFATHYPGQWVAAAPGAGFSETADFLKTFQGETLNPTWYERKLWHLYDATDYALNLFNCPTVAYSGEKDRQKQAADQMERALAAAGIRMVHIIGAGAEHHYTPAAKDEINARIDNIAQRGRKRVPESIRFTTFTLRYNRCLWLELDGLGEHWTRAQVDARLVQGPSVDVALTTENVTALTLRFAAGECPLDILKKPRIEVDGVAIEAPQPLSDRSWLVRLAKLEGRWQLAPAEKVEPTSLAKRPGLQGPIDDAFLSSFVMVAPSGSPLNEKVGQWTAAEMKHAVDHWRRQFRGDARVKADKDVSDADIAESNLILWGDPSSNALLAKIADRLPIRWTAAGIQCGGKTYSAAEHVPVLIYPNPLNPRRYVVVNSGFTFREYDYLNNARQVPKLPDFAMIDLRVPVSSRLPGGIADSGVL